MYVPRYVENETVEEEDADERRSIKRRHLIYYLRVWDRDTDEVLGHVVDITTGGLMLISEKAIPKDKEFNLEMRWSDPQGGDQTLKFRARSCWLQRDVNPAFQDTGFMLLDQTPEILFPIRELIERFGFHD